MSTYGFSYKKYSAPKRSASNDSTDGPGGKRNAPLHPQTHTAETLTSGKRIKFDPAAKLFIGNLSWDTTLESLAHYFSSFGKLMDAKIIKDHDTGNSKGFAFVTYSSAEEALHCRKWCAMNYPRLDGRNIYVSSVEWQPKAIRDAKREEKKKAKEAEGSLGPTLHWEFKWSLDKDAEVHGPYDTKTMQNWASAGYFLHGAFVRQIDFNSISDWIVAQNNSNKNDFDAEAEVETTSKLAVNTQSSLAGLVSYSDDESDNDDESTAVTDQNSEEVSISATNEEEDTNKEPSIATEKPEDKSEENTVAIELEFIPISEIDFALYP